MREKLKGQKKNINWEKNVEISGLMWDINLI